MSSEDDVEFAPIRGEVIPRSVRKAFGLIFLLFLLFCFCAFLVLGWIYTWLLEPGQGDRYVTLWGLCLGVLGVLLIPVFVFELVRLLLVRRRLVLGRDCLQLIQRKGGEDVVVTQIPYHNIADVRYKKTDSERFVGIRLKRLDDPDTLELKAESFENRDSAYGWHFVIDTGYQLGPRTIYERLMDRLDRFDEGRGRKRSQA